MKCPKCLGKLSPVEIGNVEIDRCFVCEGLWFDPNELERVLESYSKELQKINLDSKLFDGKEAAGYYGHLDGKHGSCPKCKEKMFRVRFDEVKAESCPRGHGIWLDGGEIAHLKKLKKRTFFEIIKHILSFKSAKELKNEIRDSK